MDGTVHESTLNTLNYPKRLLDYQDTVQSMLTSMGEFWILLPGNSDQVVSSGSIRRTGGSLKDGDLIRNYFGEKAVYLGGGGQ